MDADLEGAEGHEDARHEWGVRHERFYNDGYRDALDLGKTATVQEGFDAGYAEGAQAGAEWGFVRGALVSLLALPQGLAPAQLQAVQNLHARVAAAEGEAAALACLAAAEPGGGRGAPGGPAAGQSDGGCAPPDRLQAQKAQRWRGLRAEARRTLEQLGLELPAREARPHVDSAEARTSPADATGS